MEYYYTVYLALLPIIIICYQLKHFSKFSKSKLPPGPRPWPIIGNIHQLGNKPHRSVAELAKTYGPIMSLKLGTVTTIVISSPDVAKEIFLKHDLAFSNRKIADAVTATNQHKLSVIWLPVCPEWRQLKKIVTVNLFTNQRLDASKVLRQNKVDELVEHARRCCEKGEPVDIGKAGFTTALNLLSNTFFSIDLASHDSWNSQEFKDLISDLMEDVGRPNVSNFFPMLRNLDLQGVRRRMTAYFLKVLGIFEQIIDTRLRDTTGSKDDVLATLLELVEDNELSLDFLKRLLVDLFIAGTDTTSSTLEWAMTELLRNPEKMAKAQAELDQVLGKNESIQESDISKLPYIQAVVKETFRLHPPAPFLVPRKAEEDVQLCGYFVPKNSLVWVNVWSIGRDQNVWPNALSFSPERFLQSDIDIKGRDFELIPFGAGRRICPGMPLADRMVHLMLATLLHSFNWKYAYGSNPEDIDVDEKFGITLQKVQPLQAIPFSR